MIIMEIVAFFKSVEAFFKKLLVLFEIVVRRKIFRNAEKCKKSGKLTQSLNSYKDYVRLCEENGLNNYHKAKSLFEIGDIYYYTKNNSDEALNYFTKVIEEFKNRLSDKEIRVCVVKAYNRRGIVEHAIATKDSSGRIDLRKSKENYAQVIDTFSEYEDPDVVLEVAGTEGTFCMAWECARPNAIVTVVALYDGPQTLPLPDMYGKNLIFKTGGVDGCDCDTTLALIEQGLIDTTPLITHTYKLSEIEAPMNCLKTGGTA